MIYLPAEFPLENDLCYLNHAAVSPWPRRAAEAVQRFAFANMSVGAERYPEWLQIDRELRESLRWLINAPSADDIALVKNTSEGLSFVAMGLDWNAGDEIVGIAHEFPSNRIVWESLADRGVRFVSVDTHAAADPEGELIGQLNHNTRLLAVSSVHYATGLRLDLQRLAQACRERGVLLCVDAIQSLGAVPFDLREIPADFVVADGHKWMLGPEGLGLFYVNPALRDSLKLTQFGWAMCANPGDFSQETWRPAESAHRFECGSPNMLGAHALHASLGVFQEVGMPEVQAMLQNNMQTLFDLLGSIDRVRIATPREAQRRAGILSFTVEGADSDALWRKLMDARVICASRGGYLRFSPHFYTRQEVLERAVGILQGLINDFN
jgi:selenocysteine lyase/cysteine desulfurase